MLQDIFATIRSSPLWVILAAYGGLSLAVALLATNLTRGWLKRGNARSPTHLNEVLVSSLPRPVGVALFLAEVGAGLRWLPMPEPLELVTRRLLPFSLGILAVAVVMRVARKSIDAYGRSNPGLRSSAGIAHAIAWVVGLCAIALIASDALGISLAPALTALGVGSLAVALALQDTLSNFFSGIYLIMDKPVRPGDFVRLEQGHEGYVESIGWRSTQLRTLVDSTVIVPNATLAKGVLTNFHATNPRLVVEVRIHVASQSDPEKVESILVGAAKECESIAGVRDEPHPCVRFAPGYVDGGLAFTVRLRIDPTADVARVEHEVRKRAFALLRRGDIAMSTKTDGDEARTPLADRH